MTDSAAGANGGAPKKGGALKVVLLVGGVFLLLCLGVCGGLFAIGLMVPKIPDAPPSADAPTFKPTVAELEAAIPLLKETGHVDGVDQGQPIRTWQNIDGGGHKHTVVAWGPADKLTQIVVQTHIPKTEDKLTQIFGMALAYSLVEKLDSSVKADQLEGFIKWSYAAMGRENYGNVKVQIRGKGNDEIGQKIEYTLTPVE